MISSPISILFPLKIKNHVTYYDPSYNNLHLINFVSPFYLDMGKAYNACNTCTGLRILDKKFFGQVIRLIIHSFRPIAFSDQVGFRSHVMLQNCRSKELFSIQANIIWINTLHAYNFLERNFFGNHGLCRDMLCIFTKSYRT